MRNSKLIIFLISFLILTTLFSFQVYSKKPFIQKDLEISLTAGCSVKKCIKICNPANKNLHLKITYKISPDSEGINIDIPKNIVIHKKSVGRIFFTITTSMLLLPQSYKVQIMLYEVVDNGKHNGQKS